MFVDDLYDLNVTYILFFYETSLGKRVPYSVNVKLLVGFKDVHHHANM